MKKAVLAALGVLLLVTLTACGSGAKAAPKLDKEGATVAANIAKSFNAQSAGALTNDQANCFATNFVSSVGVAKLKSAKLISATGELNQTGAAFDADTAGKLADSFLGCIDYQKLAAQQMAKTDSTIDATKMEACLKQQMPSSYVKQLIVAEQTQSADRASLNTDSAAKIKTCRAQSVASAPSSPTSPSN